MNAPPAIATLLLVAVVGLFLALIVMEKLHPLRAFSRDRLKAAFSTNTSAFLINNLIMSAVSASSLIMVAGAYSRHGLLANAPDGPAKWALSFILFDFAVYAWHFAGHRFEPLWRFHKVHHSDRTFQVSTGLRFHVFDQFLEVIVKCLCTVTIGVEAHVVIVCEVVRMLFVLFHHANITFPGEKLLSWLIITPSLHRAHHSTRRSQHDSNFGVVLAVWDMIFGTRKELTPKSVGLELIQAENLVQLFSLAFVTEERLAQVIHLVPRKRRDR
ncbi:MAG: sterol desaturase family protein [Methylocystis sp.]|uniref:sterol desaturase family protein n=1 Tax=Methylocystis sp. TaxID=1911079 RepID=UPI003DA30DFE